MGKSSDHGVNCEDKLDGVNSGPQTMEATEIHCSSSMNVLH